MGGEFNKDEPVLVFMMCLHDREREREGGGEFNKDEPVLVFMMCLHDTDRERERERGQR